MTFSRSRKSCGAVYAYTWVAENAIKQRVKNQRFLADHTGTCLNCCKDASGQHDPVVFSLKGVGVFNTSFFFFSSPDCDEVLAHF